jgi:hypothetical protein
MKFFFAGIALCGLTFSAWGAVKAPSLNPSDFFAEREEYEASPGVISLGGKMIFLFSSGPLSYETLTPGELPKGAKDAGIVQCSSCQHGLSVPLVIPTPSPRGGGGGGSLSGGYGNGGFEKAIENLKKDYPDLRGVYDVKIDVHRINILGIYRKLCTEVTARAFK